MADRIERRFDHGLHERSQHELDYERDVRNDGIDFRNDGIKQTQLSDSASKAAADHVCRGLFCCSRLLRQ